MSCDFDKNDLTSVQISSELCGGKCAETSSCTHFTWTSYNGGTCWMKKGPVSKDDARETGDQSMVCGVMSEPSLPSPSQTVFGVHTTFHGARESGACALPVSQYSVVHPVALGNIESLKHLKFRLELCGQILTVNCGHGSLNIIVTNSNLGGGLDLYTSTWNQLTNNQSPGIVSCSVQLTSRNAFDFNEPRCFYKPGTGNDNSYYRNVGLLNTNGRIVRSATIDQRLGEHRGDNPYFAFNFGSIDVNKQVIFTFEDGTTHSVLLRDCDYQQNEQIWS